MFWQRYLKLCNSVGKSPNLVASEIGVKSSGTVTGWKNGALPRENVLLKLADYFCVSVADLSGEEENKKSPAPEGAELDPVTKELFDIVNTSDEDELKTLLEMARLLKKRRN